VLHGGTGGSGGDPVPKWVVAGASFSHVEYLYIEGNTSENMSDWKTCTFITSGTTNAHPCPPLPASGNLEILLIHGTFSDLTDVHFNNLRFQYISYINGGYPDYSGQSFKIEQVGNYKAHLDDVVHIGDSPNKLVKGAMFKLVAGKYVLAGRWFAGGDLANQSIIPPFPPPDIYLHPFGHLQIYGVWNQYNRRMIELSGSVKGLRASTTSIPDVTDNYLIDAVTPEVNYTNKRFMIVGMEQEYKKEQWSIVLVEVYDTAIGKDFLSALTFKYEGQ
jgi:hypothetical protein